MTRKLRFLFLLCCLSASVHVTCAAGAGDHPENGSGATTELRRHFVLRHNVDKIIHFEVTEIIRRSEVLSHGLLLVRDVEHGDVICESKFSFAEHLVVDTISDVARKTFIRASFPTPGTAKTRKETLEEAGRNPALASIVSPITITTTGGEWRSVDQEEKDWQRLRQLRHSIRPTVSFFLLEAAERMRGTVFSTVTGTSCYVMVGKYLVYEPDERASLQLEETTMPPACDFDESFGYPCSAKQLKRIEAAEKSGQLLEQY